MRQHYLLLFGALLWFIVFRENVWAMQVACHPNVLVWASWRTGDRSACAKHSNVPDNDFFDNIMDCLCQHTYTPTWFHEQTSNRIFHRKIRPAFSSYQNYYFSSLITISTSLCSTDGSFFQKISVDKKLDTKLPVVAQTWIGYQSRPTSSGADKTSETPAGPIRASKL